ncbi:hypothetical protein F0P96_11290 [Hymenobacter busanensis]|uniref:Uncharacterized protein n=1 Tax=Hymenobacter busanensis TaxID=2607656 RepID=A0A7L4ZXP6_9BACT|nr:hypothetical protein [Hymenobacter busanensis]KAA9332067.1 hypothetical protein F0P96_11290 [Hymenobacter busanensis]QHJ07595.1 hypothetical protein GUY19_09985 [Hymenobacter busanensis]
MKHAYSFGLAFLGLALSVSLTSCLTDGKEDDPTPTDNGVTESLHFAFKTPDWQRQIDCTHLDLNAYGGFGTTTYYTSATSASTNSTFYLSYPKDSSAIVAATNLKKYPIADYGQSTELPFRFSLKLPTTEGSTGRLVSKAGESADVFNEIVAVKYAGRDGSEAKFDVKGRYQMQVSELNTTNVKTVTGTYHFRIRTTRR